jgi:preprotein translocase subunit SecE
MNLPKTFQKKDDGEGQSGKAQRADNKAPPKPLKAKKTESVKKASKKPSEPFTAYWHRFRQYLREVAFELRKVVWPSRKETIGSTAVVLVIVIISGAFLGVVDLFLSRLIRLFIG